MDKYFMILAGAGVGGVLRYVIGAAIMARFGPAFPLGTVLVNISGCLAIGVIMTIFEKTMPHDNWGFLLVTGLLGGYTTFSSFGWETYVLIRDGSPMKGLMNAATSLFAGFFAVWCGAMLGRLLR